jgi:hypothetical protein
MFLMSSVAACQATWRRAPHQQKNQKSRTDKMTCDRILTRRPRQCWYLQPKCSLKYRCNSAIVAEEARRKSARQKRRFLAASRASFSSRIDCFAANTAFFSHFSMSSILVSVGIQPGGADGCKVVRYESATSDAVEVEQVLNDHEQALKDIGKLEEFEFASEQKRLAGGTASAAAGSDNAAAGTMAQMLLIRESGKMKMVKDLLLSSTSGAPSLAGINADVRVPVEDAVRIAAKAHQLSEASALLRKNCQIFEKRARSTMTTLRDLKHKLRPLWLTMPVNHQIKICVGSDTYGGDIPCFARCVPSHTSHATRHTSHATHSSSSSPPLPSSA